MGENNEYYAEKMRQLLENKDRAERIGIGNGTPVPTKQTEEEYDAEPQKDFSFDEKKKRTGAKERPRNFEEKQAQVKAAEAQARAEKSKRKYTKKDIIISAVLVCAIFVLGVFCIYKLLFVISDITVEGNEVYSDEQILASAGINTGANLYSFSSRIAEENIMMYCPKVSDIKVKRTPPGKIVVQVEEDKPCFWADFYGESRALTADLRVLGSVTEKEKEELIRVTLPTVGRAVAGETVVFTAGEMKYVFEVAKAVAASDLCGRMNRVDLTNSYDVRMVCDGKYLLKLEEYKDSAAKLKIAAKILENDIFNNDNKATIDLSELSESGVIIDNQLELEW